MTLLAPVIPSEARNTWCTSIIVTSAGLHKPMSNYYVYVMNNQTGTLYTGVTNDLRTRIYQHKHKLVEGFTSKYNVTRLAYFEETKDVTAAIQREKEIKGWRRSKKLDLIKSMNPAWRDLAEDWFDE
jgi:putative endonuclease